MPVRRALPLFVLALALIAPAQAAAKARPAVPKLIIVVTDGDQNTGKVSSTVQATFSPPKGKTAAAACTGKIAFKAPIGKKTVKKRGKKIVKTIYAKKSGPLSAPLGVCTASAALGLPSALVGKTVKFTASFAGNRAVKPFVKSSRLTVPAPAVPVPTIDLQRGAWTIVSGTGMTQKQWAFTVAADGSVSSVQRFSALDVTCAGSMVVSVGASSAPFNTPFQTGPVDIAPSDTETASGQNILQQLNIHFDSASHGTGTFRMTGTILGPVPALAATTLYPGCDSGVLPIEVKPGLFA